MTRTPRLVIAAVLAWCFVSGCQGVRNFLRDPAGDDRIFAGDPSMFIGKEVTVQFRWGDRRVYGYTIGCVILRVERGHIVVRGLHMDAPHYKEVVYPKLLKLGKLVPVEGQPAAFRIRRSDISHIWDSFGFLREREGAAKQPFLLPPGMPKPNRICGPIGNIVSEDEKWLAFLRRAEWDRRGYGIPYMLTQVFLGLPYTAASAERIPYMLTEVWVRERQTRHERRVLDYTRLSSKWTRRVERKETFFRRAGGFTFRYMSWSPSSRALALEDAGDEKVCRGSVIIDLERDRIIEIEGIELDWSPDGTMLAACSSCAFGCPDGFLMVDLRSGEVKHHFRGVDMGGEMAFGWHSLTEYAFVALLKGRGGWWKYEPVKGEATLTPLDVGAINSEPVRWTQTWWPPEPGRCGTGPP